LKGEKHLIVGNHDKNLRKLTNMFESVSDIKHVRFKREQFPFIEEFEFVTDLCHYPLVSWLDKPRWACQLHGHVHALLDSYNKKSTDMRWDVGFDGQLAYHGLVSLEKVYCEYRKKKFVVGDVINNR
jgi:calcineurin-like phosphoesterase family protein